MGRETGWHRFERSCPQASQGSSTTLDTLGMQLLDTDILIDVLRGFPPATAWLSQSTDAPAIPGYVMLELLQGCANKREVRKVEGLVRAFLVVWPTVADCERCLKSYPRLHLRSGVGILDARIGTTAIGLNATLCTFNVRHYSAISGLVTEQPYSRRLTQDGKPS